MIDYIKEIKTALSDLNYKPIYSCKVIDDKLMIKNEEKNGKRIYQIYFSERLKMELNNVFISDKDRGYAARHIYNNLMCEGLI